VTSRPLRPGFDSPGRSTSPKPGETTSACHRTLLGSTRFPWEPPGSLESFRRRLSIGAAEFRAELFQDDFRKKGPIVPASLLQRDFKARQHRRCLAGRGPSTARRTVDLGPSAALSGKHIAPGGLRLAASPRRFEPSRNSIRQRAFAASKRESSRPPTCIDEGKHDRRAQIPQNRAGQAQALSRFAMWLPPMAAVGLSIANANRPNYYASPPIGVIPPPGRLVIPAERLCHSHAESFVNSRQRRRGPAGETPCEPFPSPNRRTAGPVPHRISARGHGSTRRQHRFTPSYGLKHSPSLADPL